MKTFRAFFLSLIAVALTSCATSKNITKPFGKSETGKTEIIQTLSGPVQGIVPTAYNKNNKRTYENSDVELFAGIPFAKPPVGDLRWREPQAPEPWTEVYQADTFKPMAMQNTSGWLYTKLFNAYIHSNSRTDFAPTSEDCLYLNIWRPTWTGSSGTSGAGNYGVTDTTAGENSDTPDTSANGAVANSKLPVLVYIHGGSLMTGSSWFESYDGGSLASQGIIVVTITYRTGIFGYFADKDLAAESPNGTTGNYGLLDQVQALKWINQNIGAFGGDKDNITIAGESAGSSSVSALCSSPLAKGLFRRAIGESSSVVLPLPPHTFRTMDKALAMGEDIKKEFKVSSVAELRKIPAEKLIKTKYRNDSMTVDGYALPKMPWEIYQAGENNEEALLNGFNAREGFSFTFFSKINKKNYKDLIAASSIVENPQGIIDLADIKTNKEAKTFYNDVFTACCFTYPHYMWSKAALANGEKVWEYYFTKENGGIGTNHSGEMIYAYGNVPRNNRYDEKDYELERIMTGYWVNFVKYGDPNGTPTGTALPYWENLSESGGKVIELGERVQMTDDPFMKFYEFLK